MERGKEVGGVGWWGGRQRYYIIFSLSEKKKRNEGKEGTGGFSGPKCIIRARFNFNKCGFAFWLAALFDLGFNICIPPYLQPTP